MLVIRVAYIRGGLYSGFYGMPFSLALGISKAVNDPYLPFSYE